jgi:hypothetical protein
MQTESGSSPAGGSSRLERTIVLQLLRRDRPQRWSRAELATELQADTPALEAAVRALEADGVLCSAGGEVWASHAAQRLDELELIGI